MNSSTHNNTYQIELLPCPHCGGCDIVYEPIVVCGLVLEGKIICRGCNSEFRHLNSKDEGELALAWNKRNN